MIIRYAFLLLNFFVIRASAQPSFQPEEMVNVLMGTDSKLSYSNGNTYPAIAVPWGMNFWTPQTGYNGNGWT